MGQPGAQQPHKLKLILEIIGRLGDEVTQAQLSWLGCPDRPGLIILHLPRVVSLATSFDEALSSVEQFPY